MHSTEERSAGASFGGRDGLWERVRVAIYETRGLLIRGFANSDWGLGHFSLL